MEYQPAIEYEITPIPVPDPKQTRRAASFCAFAAVAQTVIAYGLVILFSLLMRNVPIGERAYADLSLAVNTVAVDLVAMPLAWLLLLRRTPKNAAPQTESYARSYVGTFFFYLPCAFLLMYAGALTGRLVGMFFGKGLNDVVDNMIGSVDVWVSLLCAGIVGPVCEELFFRKAMMDRLSGIHPTDAILFTALLFGLVHGNLTQFLYAFPLGVLLGYVYHRTGKIGNTIALHIGINLIGGIVPQLIETINGIGGEGAKYLTTLATLLYSSATIALCILGIVRLIRYRRQFFAPETDFARYRRPFYLNAGFIVACVVFTALFVLAELPLSN